MMMGYEWTCLLLLLGAMQTYGGEQPTEIINCDAQSDIVFMVDTSWSIRDTNPDDASYDNWQIVKDFIVNITMRMPVTTAVRIGVLKFANKVDRNDIIELNDYTDANDLKRKINNLNFVGGGTNTSGAIWYINSNGSRMFNSNYDRSDAQNIGIIVTDGLSNKDANLTKPYARDARIKHKTKIMTVGITKFANEDELEEISSDPVSYYKHISHDFRNLNILTDRILAVLCREAAPPRTACRDTRADIVFLLDSSGSIGTENWITLKQFVIGVIDSMDLSDDRTRVSVIRYSTKADVVFHLNKYFGPDSTGSFSDMRRQIMELEYLDDKTNISGALKVMRSEVLTENMGARPGVKSVGILLTDGEGTEDVNDTQAITHQLRDVDGVVMFAVGLTKDTKVQELHGIASKPLSVYYLNATRIGDAPFLTSRLVWGICNKNCEGDATDNPSCWRNSSLYGCSAKEEPKWYMYENRILLGHNYDRLENVVSANECILLCSRDAECRSVDYIRTLKQCAVSYVTKDEHPSSFVEEFSADYYELSCEKTLESGRVPNGGVGMDGGEGDGGGRRVFPTDCSTHATSSILALVVSMVMVLLLHF